VMPAADPHGIGGEFDPVYMDEPRPEDSEPELGKHESEEEER